MKTHKGSLALRSALVALIAFAILTPAHADVMYTFNITPTNSAFQQFSFEFTDSTFVANGDQPSFSPFSVTNGIHTWTMDNDLALITGSGNGCFEFGNLPQTLLTNVTNGCGVIFLPTPASFGAFSLQIAGGLPTADGAYAVAGSGGFQNISNLSVSGLNGTLTVSSSDSVPEPCNLILLSTGLLGVGPLVRARRKQTN